MVLQCLDDFSNWNILNYMIYSALNLSHILQNYQLPAYSCSSVIVCIPTMLTESHGSSRQRYGFPRNLHDGDTVSTRITPDEAISPDQHGRPRMF